MTAPSDTHMRAEMAVNHVVARDLRETWIPDPVGYHDVFDNRDALIGAAIDVVTGNAPPSEINPVAVPKNHFLTRDAAQLDPVDRVAFHACLAHLQQPIEEGLHIGVMCGRSPQKSLRDQFLFADPIMAWKKWQKRARDAAVDGTTSISTDISNYFAFVQHDRLMASLEQFGLGKVHASTVRTLLNTWTGTAGRGLPQGPDICRLLGNCYLIEADRKLARHKGLHYLRYMDDVILTARGRRRVIDAFREFEGSAGELGLSIAGGKTRMTSGRQTRDRINDPSIASVNVVYLRDKNDPIVRARLQQLVHDAYDEETHNVDGRPVRYALPRLARLGDDSLDLLLLNRLEFFTPLMPYVCGYLAPRLQDRFVVERISEFLLDPDRNVTHYASSWLLALLIDAEGPIHADWHAYALGRARDGDAPTYERVLAMSLVGRCGVASEIDELFHWAADDPSLCRGALIAAQRGGLDLPTGLVDDRRIAWTVGYLATGYLAKSLPKR
jgi:Reverse transcriptase (RNA-dependent DNA polymerase)